MMLYKTLLRLTPLTWLFAGYVSGQPQVIKIAVPAKSNIFAAGQSVAFSGELPPAISFAAGSLEAVTFAGTAGLITLGGGEPWSGPDGIPFPGGTDLTSFNGLSGIIAKDKGFFLTGVFLDDSVPGGAGPPVLNFTGRENFLALKPQLFQTFYIGDGLIDGTATRQIFFVPQGATRLFLGIADGCVLAGGPPGCYDDNKGAFGAAVVLHPVSSPPAGN
jgi:hypothetical protein